MVQKKKFHKMVPPKKVNFEFKNTLLYCTHFNYILDINKKNGRKAVPSIEKEKSKENGKEEEEPNSVQGEPVKSEFLFFFLFSYS